VLVAAAAVVGGAAGLAALVPGAGGYRGVLRRYAGGGGAPGAGDLLLSALGPAILALGHALYERRALLAANARAVVGAAAGGAIFGLISSAGAARALGLARAGGAGIALAVLTRQVTTPLAILCARVLGADAGVAAATAVLTGLVGANQCWNQSLGRRPAWDIFNPLYLAQIELVFHDS